MERASGQDLWDRVEGQGRRALACLAGCFLAGFLLLPIVARAGEAAAGAPPSGEETPRVASRAGSTSPPRVTTVPEALPAVSPQSNSPVVDTTLPDTVRAAKLAIATCQVKFARVEDYTCLFLKRERVDGALGLQQIMHMKVRTQPMSIYLKFQKPNKGREAIYVTGRHRGQVLAHDVGLFKVLAGSMLLDPKGDTAMDGCRHPITEAGIGTLIETIAFHWERELTPEESRVVVNPYLKIGTHPCTMIESIHTERRAEFLFHRVRLYIDHETGLPMRFEAYDWPKHPGDPDLLVEEYAYIELKLNAGLTDHDFDPNNRSYSFGRF